MTEIQTFDDVIKSHDSDQGRFETNDDRDEALGQTLIADRPAQDWIASHDRQMTAQRRKTNAGVVVEIDGPQERDRPELSECQIAAHDRRAHWLSPYAYYAKRPKRPATAAELVDFAQRRPGVICENQKCFAMLMGERSTKRFCDDACKMRAFRARVTLKGQKPAQEWPKMMCIAA